MYGTAVPAQTARRTDAPAGSADTAAPAGAGAGAGCAADTETVVVHVQLRPRRGVTRKCLAALAALAAEHPAVAFGVTGLSKDDRIVRVTVGVELGPRLGVAKFSPEAQAAYAFVSAIFSSLYDHMPVYTAEPSETERRAASALLDSAVAGRPESTLIPAPRTASAAERISA